MILKKLEIIGFKSFFDRASIEFPSGISAVVGPNGCGKSNIVDALRWVMGEQSVKQLRGKSMEDVIFSGTNGHPPLNMAEVTLTLSNDNGSAPEEFKDYTEIMLTRRLYRSGESAYLLNKQPCRLKDIHNVFLGSGMSAKSYAVIQQGRIGAITEANPEERRFFLEEAAGTTRFKNRKVEALRKVEATNQNLLRLSDIISEIKRQMNGLKYQARKAARYKKYQDRVKNLDIRLALHHYLEFTRQIEETDTLLAQLRDADIDHTTQLQKLDAAVEEIKLQRWQKNQEISEQKNQHFETQRNIDRLENDLAHLSDDVNRLAEEMLKLGLVQKEIEEKNSKIGTEIEQGENHNNRLTEEIHIVRADLENERSAALKIKDQWSTLNQELENHKNNLLDLTAQEAQYKNIYQNAYNNKESLKRRLKSTEEETKMANKKAAKAQEQEVTAKKNLATLKKEINTISKSVETVQRQIAKNSQTLSQQIKQVQTLELEKNKIRSKYNTLKKMEDNFEWYKDGVKAIMKNSIHSGKLDKLESKGTGSKMDGILGLMADIIEPEPSFEIAVEAALGESLQYVIVNDQQSGLEAIDYLQAHNAGRSGFVPISSIKQLESKQENESDRQNNLLKHVTVKPNFEKIAHALLGHVVVATGMDEALKLHNINGAQQTIVTQDGDIISPQGIMIGGSQEKVSGILAKKQELQELQRQNKQYTQQLESAREAQKDIEDEVRKTESQLQKLIDQKNHFQQQEIEAEKALYKASEDLKHTLRHLEIVKLEREQLLGEKIDIDDEMAKYNMAVNEISNEIEIAQQTVSEKSEQMSAVSSKMEEFNQKVVDHKLKLTTLAARLDNGNNTLRRLREFQEDGIKQVEQLADDMTRKKQKELASKNKIEEHHQTLSDMYKEMKVVEQAIARTEADYHTIDAKLKDSDTIISEIQNKRESVLKKLHLLELEQSQRCLQRDNIASRLEERYHEPFSEYQAELVSLSNSEKTGEMTPAEMTPEKMEDELVLLTKRIATLGDVNLGAIHEYENLKDRFNFLCEQRDDLNQAVEDLQQVIKKIDRITHQRFMQTFDSVNEILNDVFPRLFEGGSAKLMLTNPDDPLETGVEYMIHPPGKKLTRMSLLSGGEKALAAIAFIFSLYLLKPASFCLMDEIDAPLDDANIYRFNSLLKLIGEKSQIVMVTHNKKSMEFADTLFGITMEKKGISKIVSVNFDRSAGQNS
jgi:chromosome segregation protein